ncbi:MAG: DUF6935 domain-containing protein [Oscillospiraceae bacterium]
MAEIITFAKLPVTLAELQALPEATLENPAAVAALTVAALAAYPADKNAAAEMLNFLRGPRPLTNYDLQFISDRFRGKDYLMRSYFEGSSPENNYTPAQPYSVVVSENPHSRDAFSEGYITLYVKCSGADSPRPVKLRHKPSVNKWYLWEQYLLTGIRIPAALDDWS